MKNNWFHLEFIIGWSVQANNFFFKQESIIMWIMNVENPKNKLNIVINELKQNQPKTFDLPVFLKIFLESSWNNNIASKGLPFVIQKLSLKFVSLSVRLFNSPVFGCCCFWGIFFCYFIENTISFDRIKYSTMTQNE